MTEFHCTSIQFYTIFFKVEERKSLWIFFFASFDTELGWSL